MVGQEPLETSVNSTVEGTKLDIQQEEGEIINNEAPSEVQHTQGFRANWKQILVLIGCLFSLGGLFGLERTLLPLMAEPVWGEDNSLTITTIVISFGLSKAIANGAAGLLSDKFGRKLVSVMGMCIAVPVPIIIIFAPKWIFVTIANLGLGASQGLAASAIVLMLIDLFGESKRGIAVGTLECSIYVSVAIWSFIGVQLATWFGYQPVPFSVGAVLAVFGAILSLVVTDTLKFVSLEVKRENLVVLSELEDPAGNGSEIEAIPEDHWLSKKRIWFFLPTLETIPELTYPKVIAACFANKQIALCIFSGVVNNVKDGLAWVVFPLYFSDDWEVEEWIIGILMLVYPLTWGVLQLFTGAASDKISRKIFLVSGMFVQGTSLLFMVSVPFVISDHSWRIAMWFYCLFFLGVGTALIYPVIQAAVSDEVPAEWRGVGIGIYRFCRDMGYVAGALVAGLFARRSVAIIVSAILLLLCSILILIFFVTKPKPPVVPEIEEQQEKTEI